MNILNILKKPNKKETEVDVNTVTSCLLSILRDFEIKEIKYSNISISVTLEIDTSVKTNNIMQKIHKICSHYFLITNYDRIFTNYFYFIVKPKYDILSKWEWINHKTTIG